MITNDREYRIVAENLLASTSGYQSSVNSNMESSNADACKFAVK